MQRQWCWTPGMETTLTSLVSPVLAQMLGISQWHSPVLLWERWAFDSCQWYPSAKGCICEKLYVNSKFGRGLGGCPDHHLQFSSEDISPLSAQENHIYWDNFAHRSLEQPSPLKVGFSYSAALSALPVFSHHMAVLLSLNREWTALNLSQDPCAVCRDTHCSTRQERHFCELFGFTESVHKTISSTRQCHVTKYGKNRGTIIS